MVSPSVTADVKVESFEGRHRRLRETTFQLLTIFGTLPTAAQEIPKKQLKEWSINVRVPADRMEDPPANNDGFVNATAKIKLNHPDVAEAGHGTAFRWYPTSPGNTKKDCKDRPIDHEEVQINAGWEGYLALLNNGTIVETVTVDVADVERFYDWFYSHECYTKIAPVSFEKNCHGYSFDVGDWPTNAGSITGKYTVDVNGVFDPAERVGGPCWIESNEIEATVALDKKVDSGTEVHGLLHSIKIVKSLCEDDESDVAPSFGESSDSPTTETIIIAESTEKFRASGVYQQVAKEDGDCAARSVKLNRAPGLPRLWVQYKKAD